MNTTADLLDKFIGQVKACYQALGLFGQEHCVDSQDQQDYTGKVLILSPFSMEESCWDTGRGIRCGLPAVLPLGLGP